MAFGDRVQRMNMTRDAGFIFLLYADSSVVRMRKRHCRNYVSIVTSHFPIIPHK